MVKMRIAGKSFRFFPAQNSCELPPGEENLASHGAGHHAPQESPLIMTAPLAVLAAGAAFAGLAGSPWCHALWELLGVHEAHGLDVPILLLSTLAMAAGAWLAWAVGFRRRNLLPAGLRPLGRQLYALAANKYYVDEAYDRWIIQPFLSATRSLARFDLRIIDGAVDRAGQAGWSLGLLKERFDRLVVDRIVDGTALAVRGLGTALRRIQTGVIQHYLLVVVVAVVALSIMLRR